MAAMHRFAVKGFYKEQFCRSLHEFHACLYLDKVKKVEFITEPFSMRSAINSKRKIPDIMYFDLLNKEAVILEIKPSKQLSESTLCDYANNKFRLPANVVEFVKGRFDVKYQFWSNCSVKLKKDIVAEIGVTEYSKLLNEYRNQQQTYTGFPGKLNPMYGRKHSAHTKKLISDDVAKRGGHAGEKNGMYGKSHTTVAKAAVGAKWYLPATRNAILRNSLLNRLEKLDITQYNEYIQYCFTVMRGENVASPKFMNGIPKITENRVNELFGSYTNFWNFIKVDI